MKYIYQREGTRFKIGRKSYRIDIRKVGIHENTFIFLKEKKIRNEFVRTLLMQDQGNLHDDCEERRKIWRNLNGGISTREGATTRRIAFEKNWYVW